MHQYVRHNRVYKDVTVNDEWEDMWTEEEKELWDGLTQPTPVNAGSTVEPLPGEHDLAPLQEPQNVTGWHSRGSVQNGIW